jgi:D-alanyl-D-alanine carboxypeptidase
MEVSDLCRKFIDRANVKDWKKAVEHLNELKMYEMLRSLKALDPDDDIKSLRAALTGAGGAVDGPRIEYALAVVVDKKVPDTAPGDLEKTGQVKDATAFVKAKLPTILIEMIPTPKIKGYNGGLSSASNPTMTTQFGAPREDYSQDCQPITNKTLAKRIVTKNVGPFKVSGLDNAVDSLTTVMKSIAKDQRLVYRVLGTAGMLCARNVRGSKTNISNHSWGTAIDLTIDKHLDPRGDNLTQFGLHLISGIFNDNGWYWGAGFKTEDSQHFEVGAALVKKW